jgi:hypothetical protein
MTIAPARLSVFHIRDILVILNIVFCNPNETVVAQAL